MNKTMGYIKEDINHFWTTTDFLFVPAIHYPNGVCIKRNVECKHYKAVTQGLQDKHTKVVQSFKPWQVKTFETIKNILN